jgi:NAD(P)-dependent dehydrogenase (short-subunit alcohol dehydrogenase family)
MIDTGPLLGNAIALVTGAGSGIGQAAALKFAKAGAVLALIDISGERLHETVAKLPGTDCLQLEADLSVAGSVESAAQRVLAELGHVDILVNCAGAAGKHTPLVDVTLEDWEHVHAVNVRAPFLLMQRIGRAMVERRQGGRIVSVSSSSAHRARFSRAPYGSSKAALEQLTRSAAAEFGPHGINVNAVAPGVTDTPWNDGNMDQAAMQRAVNEGPLSNLLHRVSLAEDVADAVLFLCSPQSRQITGQTIHVSAGAIV